MKRVEVFKTNVAEASQAEKLVRLLGKFFPGSKINFDLEDCDKVLRMEGSLFGIQQVMALLQENGVECSVLE